MSVNIDSVKLRSEMFVRRCTQKELAERAQLSRPVLSSICNGKSCRKETAQKIADALCVPLESITIAN